MPDLLTPAKWPAAAEMPGPAEKVRFAPFLWPTPPFASYPQPTEQTRSMGCSIVGLNGSQTIGRLVIFVPEESAAHVQVPPSRSTLRLPFGKFKSLTIRRPLSPIEMAEGDSVDPALDERPRSSYKVEFKAGGEVTGETIGYVETPFGLFLFPPVDDAGSVQRVFVPRESYKSFQVGPRIGALLIEQKTVTAEQVEEAASEQQRLRSQKLGDILLTRRIVTPDQLLQAIETQSKMPIMRIGEALLAMGMISQAQLNEALLQQTRDRGVPLGELLINLGMVSRADLQAALARKMGYPLVEIEQFPVDPEALQKVAYGMALRLKLMPLLLRNGRLIIALDDPARRRSAVDEIEFATQLKVVPVLTQCETIEDVLRAAYEKIGAANLPRFGGPAQEQLTPEAEQHATDKLIETLEREGLEKVSSEDDRQIEQSDNSLVRLINNLIIEAYKDGVSDIHVESYPGKEKIRIRFRKDGIMRTHLELPHNYRNALIARIKIMCDLDISERRKPQDGKINFAKFSPQHRIELRVATIPTNHSLEDVVMRILASAKPLPLEKLGLSPYNLTQLKLAMTRPYGLVLCVGPTGSGKTTTLHSAMSYINVPERKIWTAEDPIEITQAGLRQVQVNPKIDWTFAKALRAFLRADPDVIMVGEIRDKETANMSVEASLTGHLVLSTLHTNSAPETVTRLLDMGMDPFNFADSLLAVLAQRLVRRLCSKCLVSARATDEQIEEWLDDYLHISPPEDARFSREAVLKEWLERFAVDGHLMSHHSPGCSHCEKSGYKGRAGLHELMAVSKPLRHMVQTGARAEQLQQVAMSEGMRTLRQDGIEKVLQGITSIEEVRATSNA
ncbi:ATPase, T2SS/T4P/T4SS family [soil metagenome]